ncbi:hypothetical protein T190607A02C_20370 [Tenacibaculum sp. 190524A02b]
MLGYDGSLIANSYLVNVLFFNVTSSEIMSNAMQHNFVLQLCSVELSRSFRL